MLLLVSLLTLRRLQKRPTVNWSLDPGQPSHLATLIPTIRQTVATFWLFLRLERFAGNITMLLAVSEGLVVVSVEDLVVVWVEGMGATEAAEAVMIDSDVLLEVDMIDSDVPSGEASASVLIWVQ